MFTAIIFALIGAAVIIVAVITFNFLIKKIKEYFSIPGANETISVKGSALHDFLKVAEENGMFDEVTLEDLEKELEGVQDDDVIMAAFDDEGNVLKEEKIKGEKGMDDEARKSMNKHKGMIKVTA